MASKEAVLQCVKNYEAIIDVLNEQILPMVSANGNSRANLVQAIKMGYKDVATLTSFIEDVK